MVEDPGDAGTADKGFLGARPMPEIQSRVRTYDQVNKEIIRELIVSAQLLRGSVPRTKQS